MKAVYRWFWCLVVLGLGDWSVDGQWCAPKLFEAKKWTLQIIQTDQGPDITESTSKITMDMIGQRLATHEVGTHNGKDYSVFYLYYYPAGTLYTVQNGVCTASPISGNVSMCFDWEGGHFIVGFAKEFIGNGEEGVCQIMGGITVLKDIGTLYSFQPEDTGVPLFTGKGGVIDGVPTYRLSSYYNVTLGIRNPDIFTPPDSCIKSHVH